MRLYPLMRICAPLIFLGYMGVRQVNPEISIFSDLILFNSIALIAGFLALAAHRNSTFTTRLSIALAILLWSIGSISSSWNSLVADLIPDWFSDLCYLGFYPLLFFGLIRELIPQRSSYRLQVLDSLIIALGISTLLTALTLDLASGPITGSSYEVFLSIFYPIADLILVATALLILAKGGKNSRNLIILSGVILFTVTDFIFLLQTSQNRYEFGSFTDTGWILSIMLISESLWHHQSERELNFNQFSHSIVFAAVISGAVIAITSLQPGLLPSAVLVPAFLTLILAFLRMAIALSDAHRLKDEKELARTDELTGLANRRRFLQELDQIEIGDWVLLLDLNGFKPINDRYGHGAGDQLLKQVALRLSRLTADSALSARLGGDEFGIIIDCQRSQLAEPGREITSAVSAAFSYPFNIVQVGPILVGASIGVVINDGGADLLRRADIAMYQGKRSGEPIVIWSSNLQKVSTVTPLNFQQTTNPLNGGN